MAPFAFCCNEFRKACTHNVISQDATQQNGFICKFICNIDITSHVTQTEGRVI